MTCKGNLLPPPVTVRVVFRLSIPPPQKMISMFYLKVRSPLSQWNIFHIQLIGSILINGN